MTSSRVPEPGSRWSQTWPASWAGAIGLPVRQRVAGRCDQRDLVRQKRASLDPLVLGRPTGDRDVHRVLADAVEERRAVLDLERELDLGVERPERAKERRDDVLGGGGDRGDAEALRVDVGGLLGRAPALLDEPENVGGIRPEGLACGGQADSAADALGQLDAELLRERRDRRRDRRLRDVELLGRRGHGALTGDGEEAGELVRA